MKDHPTSGETIKTLKWNRQQLVTRECGGLEQQLNISFKHVHTHKRITHAG